MGSSSLLQVSLSTPTTTTAAFGTNDVVSWDWNAVADHVFEDDQRPVILFDGICNLCNGGVNFALDHDAKGERMSTPCLPLELCTSSTLLVGRLERKYAPSQPWLGPWWALS
jgi:hypothetical protein